MVCCAVLWCAVLCCVGMWCGVVFLRFCSYSIIHFGSITLNSIKHYPTCVLLLFITVQALLKHNNIDYTDMDQAVDDDICSNSGSYLTSHNVKLEWVTLSINTSS